MMNVEYFNAKNNEESVSVNGKKLHSAYNPSREAESFVQGIECNFNPRFILITEPCLSYCVEPLRKRLSESKIFCVR